MDSNRIGSNRFSWGSLRGRSPLILCGGCGGGGSAPHLGARDSERASEAEGRLKRGVRGGFSPPSVAGGSGGAAAPPAETGADLNRIGKPIELNRIEPDWVESDWTGLDMDLSRIDMNRIEPDWVGIGTGSNQIGFFQPTNRIAPVFDPKEPDSAGTGSNRTGTHP